MTDIAALTAANAARWKAAKITRGPQFASVAKRLVSAKARYSNVQTRTGVPWFVIAVIHEREASQNWNTQLGQGDPLHEVSRNEPSGRGPFGTWEQGAYDALVNCHPYASRWKDWSDGGALTILEEYNGLGYAGGPAPTRGPNAGQHYPPQPSPYIWSGTDQYKSGKYVADHDFRPEVVDVQLGCAGLLLAMKTLDASISFTGGQTQPLPLPPDIEPIPAPKPKTPVQPRHVGIGVLILAAIAAVSQFWTDHHIAVLAGLGAAVAVAAIAYLTIKRKG